MIKKWSLILFCFFNGLVCMAQQNINNYKYIIVPNTYDFQSESNEYRLNNLTKLLFEKHGFNVVMSNQALPDEVINNGCLALYANVLDDSKLFSTKLIITLKNCKKELIFKSKTGESRDKKSAVAYNLALRDAFKSFDTVNYTYKASTNNSDLKDTKASKKESPETVVITTPQIANAQETTTKTTSNNRLSLKAKKRTNSALTYDLLDNTGKTIYTILFSGKEDVYMVKGEDAIIYKLNDNWVLAKSLPNEIIEVSVIEIDF